MRKIRIAIAGVGNCASSLVQGLEYYKGRKEEAFAGLMHPWIGDWGPSDIEVVAAFDIDRRKVGKRVEEAIFAKPNCTKVFQSALPVSDIVVRMGPILDGVAPHMADYPDDEAFRPADAEPVDVVQILKDAKAEVLVCTIFHLGGTFTDHHRINNLSFARGCTFGFGTPVRPPGA